MGPLSKNKAGLAFGLVFGIWHAAWAALVALGGAQTLLDWIFRLHFIQPPYTVSTFQLSLALGLVVVTTALGYVLGWLFAAVWNWLHPPGHGSS
ncbi:MAG: hypothetical protein U1F57_06360 [bacterium]